MMMLRTSEFWEAVTEDESVVTVMKANHKQGSVRKNLASLAKKSVISLHSAF